MAVDSSADKRLAIHTQFHTSTAFLGRSMGSVLRRDDLAEINVLAIGTASVPCVRAQRPAQTANSREFFIQTLGETYVNLISGPKELGLASLVAPPLRRAAHGDDQPSHALFPS